MEPKEHISKGRNSSIELLKIVAVFMIVVSHSYQNVVLYVIVIASIVFGVSVCIAHVFSITKARIVGLPFYIKTKEQICRFVKSRFDL